MSDNIEKLKADLEAAQAELKTVKGELKTTKTEATKATNNLAKVQAELDTLKAAGGTEEAAALKEENAILKQELENMGKRLEEAKEEAARKMNHELSDDMLKERALALMKQDKLDVCFITLKKGYIFRNESQAKTSGKYKIATLFDDKVVLKNPA